MVYRLSCFVRISPGIVFYTTHKNPFISYEISINVVELLGMLFISEKAGKEKSGDLSSRFQVGPPIEFL